MGPKTDTSPANGNIIGEQILEGSSTGRSAHVIWRSPGAAGGG
jgi:hypothetical protein